MLGVASGVLSSRIFLAQTVYAKIEHSKSVAAGEFQLVDEAGNVRAVLGLADKGTANLLIKDQKGNSRVVLGLTPDGASDFILADGGNIPRAEIRVPKQGQPNILFYDELGKVISEFKPGGVVPANK